MSEVKTIPNPNWVSAPYEVSGLSQTMESIFNHRHFVEEEFNITTELKTSKDESTGMIWYQIKQV